MENVYERTGLCPYTGDCDSYRTIVNSERWMERALYRLRREGNESLSFSEGGYSIDYLQTRLTHMRKVKNRCYGRNGGCLRFWQFERAKDDMEAYNRLKMELLVRRQSSPQIIDALSES